MKIFGSGFFHISGQSISFRRLSVFPGNPNSGKTLEFTAFIELKSIPDGITTRFL